jgi:hypothetical protein
MNEQPDRMPPTPLLYAFYVVLVIALVATLVLAGVYGA